MTEFSSSQFLDLNRDSGEWFFEDVIDDDGYWFFIPERLLLKKDGEDV